MNPSEAERQELIVFRLYRHKSGWRSVLPDDMSPYNGTTEIGWCAAVNIFEAIETFRARGLLS